MRVEETEIEDVERIVARPGDNYGSTSPLIEPRTAACTMWLDDEPAAIWGVNEMMPGIGVFWALISDKARGHGVRITKLANDFIREQSEAMGFFKGYAMVKSDMEEYKRWVEALGFSQEYVMRKVYPDGSDLVGYAKWVG
jgi:hypothetical protein